MNAQSKSVPEKVSVQLWVSPELRQNFQRVVQREERTVAQALRLHMAQTVAEARDEDGNLPVAA